MTTNDSEILEYILKDYGSGMKPTEREALKRAIDNTRPAPQADGEGDDDETPEPTAMQIEYARGYGDGMRDAEQIAAERAEIATSKAPAEVTDGWAKGVQACIDWVEKRRHDFEMEYGMVDPSTGAMEFRNTAREEYDIELCEIEEGLRTMRALRPTSTTRAGEGNA